MKKSERKKLIDKCDDTFSLIVRLVDRRCVICGATENLQCGHLFSRTSYATRYHPLNAFCQDRSCNMRHEFDAYPFNAWFIAQHGEPVWHELHALSAKTTHVKTWMFKEVYIAMLDFYLRNKNRRPSREELNKSARGWLIYFEPGGLKGDR